MSNIMNFDDWLKVRLTRDLPGFEAQNKMTRHLQRPTVDMAPEDVRLSAVLILMKIIDDMPHILMIKRSEYNGPHSGQMAFPGGKMEIGDESLYQTALREAHEEINMESHTVQLLGELTPLYIPVSNFLMHAFISMDEKFHYRDWSPYEVQSVHYYKLEEIFESKKDVRIQLPVYNQAIVSTAYVPQDGNVIWGASAMILSELEALYSEYKA